MKSACPPNPPEAEKVGKAEAGRKSEIGSQKLGEGAWKSAVIFVLMVLDTFSSRKCSKKILELTIRLNLLSLLDTKSRKFIPRLHSK